MTGSWRRLLAAARSPQDAEILRLALPAFGALVAEPLFLLADSAIVARIGTVPLGGLGVASQALTTLVGISIFLAYGTTAAVARQLGAGQRQAAIRQGIDGLWLAALIGVVVLAVGWPLAPIITRAFGGSAAVTAQAVIYLRISLLGAPSMLAVLAGTGVLRGLQDTRTPLLVAVAANIVNIVLNAVFVLGLHWGIAGSAWGTAIAQTATAAVYLTVVGRGARQAGVGFAPDLAGLRAAAFAGASLVLRTLALQAVLIITTAIAARQGNAAIAAHQVAFRIWGLLAYALDAIAIAGQAITGRYLGAGDVAGARAATNRMTGWGLVYGIVFGALLLALRPVLPGLFGVAPEVRHLLLGVLIIVAVQQPAAGIVFVLDGVLIGAGDQDYLALAGLATLAVFGVAAAAVVGGGGGLIALWLAFSLWMLARLATLGLRARGSRWLVTGAVRG
jgi:putative MATE family efflux protein